MRFFYFLARKINYTFALVFITVMGGWISGLFGYFIGTAFIVSQDSPLIGYIARWLPWAVGIVAFHHYFEFGMLTGIRIPAFYKSLRSINRNISGNELNPAIPDDELRKLYVYVSELPLYNMIAGVYHAMLAGVFVAVFVYIEMQMTGTFDAGEFRHLIKATGVAMMVLWILYGMSTYLLTEILTGRERATCYNELRRRGIIVNPRMLIGINFKFSFFVILMVLTLITFAALIQKGMYFREIDVTTMVAYFLASVLTAILLMMVNTNSMLRVLNDMKQFSIAVAGGAQHKFEVLSLDREFSVIEFGLMEMAREIEEHRKNMETKVEQRTMELQSALSDLKERDDLIQKQLDIAGTIQRGILPGKIDDWNEMKFSVRYIAMEKIGGDFYDVFQLKGNKLGLLIADVSGHGIPAALVTTMAKIAFGNACAKYDSPRRIFQDVNQSLIDHVKTQDYLTCFFLAFDEEYNLSYSNASHQKAILLRRDEGKIELLDTNGLFIGAIEEARDTYEEKSARLNYNDRIILYTDGISEAVDEQRREYSVERLTEAIRKFKHLTLEDFTSAIIDDVQRYIGNTQVEDDITLMVVELARDEAIDIIKSSKSLVNEGKYYEAIDYLERGLRLYPKNRKLIYNLAKTYFRINNFGKAVESINEYLQHDTRNKYAYYIAGAAHYQMLDYLKAIEMLEEALRIDQNFVNALYAQGMAYKKQGAKIDAIRCFERVVNLDAENRLAEFELSELRKAG
ncbi:MAG: tetratricopeptide repeat protein [Spirochaetes bacterium]|nr:MAG: tetratricopeptide repeat protein [Spirochaetota bacterium]